MVTLCTALALWVLAAGAICLAAAVALAFDAESPEWWRAVMLVAPVWPVVAVVWSYRTARRFWAVAL